MTHYESAQNTLFMFFLTVLADSIVTVLQIGQMNLFFKTSSLTFYSTDLS